MKWEQIDSLASIDTTVYPDEIQASTPPPNEGSRCYNKCDILIFLDFSISNPYSSKTLETLMADGHRIFCIHTECKERMEIKVRYSMLYDIYFAKKTPDFCLFSDISTHTDIYRMLLHKIFFDYDIFDAIQIVQHVSWIDLTVKIKEMHGFRLISDVTSRLSKLYQSDDLRAAYYKLTVNCDTSLKNSYLLQTSDLDESLFKSEYQAFWENCKESFPKISIVVLTYNNLVLNKTCICSILKKTAWENFELIIVDNCSGDGTREYLCSFIDQKIPNVKIILNDSNKGFAAGNNIGLRESTGEFIVLLNNDTIVTNGWLTSLVKGFHKKEIGMCGPVTNSIGNEAMIRATYSTLEEMDVFSKINTFLKFDQSFNHPRVLALFCTMIRRNVIDECGELDEQYKVGMFEDDDYAETVRSHGYELRILDDVFIHHFDGGSFKKLNNEQYKKIFKENKQIYEQKWNKKWEMHCYRNGISFDTNQKTRINLPYSIT